MKYFEILQYIENTVLKKSPNCSTIMHWLEKHNYKLKDFFILYTLRKHGTFNEILYIDSVNEFKEKHRIELEETEETYDHRFFDPNESALFNELKKNHTSEKSTVLFDEAIKSFVTYYMRNRKTHTLFLSTPDEDTGSGNDKKSKLINKIRELDAKIKEADAEIKEMDEGIEKLLKSLGQGLVEPSNIIEAQNRQFLEFGQLQKHVLKNQVQLFQKQRVHSSERIFDQAKKTFDSGKRDKKLFKILIEYSVWKHRKGTNTHSSRASTAEYMAKRCI